MLQADPIPSASKHFPTRPAQLLSLRRHLIRLALWLVVPLSIFAAALVLILTRYEKAAVRSEVEAVARALQIKVDGELESVTRSLQSMTPSSYLLSGDLTEFRRHAERMLVMQNGWVNITVLDRSGKNLVSLRATQADEMLDRDHFDLVVVTGKPAVHNLNEKRLFGVTVPVLSDGEIEYVLNASLRADLFADLLTRENLPPSWIGVIYDGKWRVIAAAHPDAVEQLAEPDLSEAIGNADRGWATANLVDNVVSYIAFSKSAISQWSVAIAVPSSAVDTRISRHLFMVTAAGLLIFTVAIWMALIRAGKLALPVEKLSENSSALGQGSFFLKPISSVKEIRDLEERFQEADIAMKRLTAQLEQLVREDSTRRGREIEEKDRIESVHRQTEFMELSHQAVLVHGFDDSRILFWNTGATRLYGWEEQEALGKSSHALLQTHFSQALEEIDNQLGRYGSWRGELTRTKKDGTRIIVASRWSLRRDQTGRPLEVIELAYDITEKKNAEKIQLENERLASLGLTAAVFAHEVANPLNNLNASLVLLDRELANAGDIPEGIKLVRAATGEIRRLNTLLEEFRSLARPQSLTRQPVNLHEIIEEVLAPMQPAQKAKISFELDFDNALPQIVADREKIKQVIVNLCNNSVEAMPGGGRLTLKSSCSGPLAVLQVSDTGVGIPPGMDVFHLFTTTKPHGTGLGLAIVKQIISAHGGTVDYVSRPGRGTTFTISLPLGTKGLEDMNTRDET